jgi:hypothetical protein
MSGAVLQHDETRQALLAEIGVLGRGATDHGRMDAEVGQPAAASDPPGPVAPAPLDDGPKITAAMIKAAVKHEKPQALSADQASPHIRGRYCTLVRVVLEAVYRRQGWQLPNHSPKASGALSKALKAGGLEGFGAVAAELESLERIRPACPPLRRLPRPPRGPGP